jgi:hypothetical protein
LASLHQKHIDLGDDFTGTLEAFFDLLQQRFVCVPRSGIFRPFSEADQF